jgi:midasin (ATPase involved in ribosome maturation)
VFSASVLDRLNALLEPNGCLVVSERGVIDGTIPTIKPHPDFRWFVCAFFSMFHREFEVTVLKLNDISEVAMNGLRRIRSSTRLP